MRFVLNCHFPLLPRSACCRAKLQAVLLTFGHCTCRPACRTHFFFNCFSQTRLQSPGNTKSFKLRGHTVCMTVCDFCCLLLSCIVLSCLITCCVCFRVQNSTATQKHGKFASKPDGRSLRK